MFLSSIFGHCRLFPSSSRFVSCSISSGCFAFAFGSFRMFLSSQFASFSIVSGCFRHSDIFGCSLSSFRFVSPSIISGCSRISCSDFPGLLRLLPDPLRIPSLPNLSVLFPCWPATKTLTQDPLLSRLKPNSMWCWELLGPPSGCHSGCPMLPAQEELAGSSAQLAAI